jgi:hypothetical protein
MKRSKRLRTGIGFVAGRGVVSLLGLVGLAIRLMSPAQAAGDFGYYDPPTFDREKSYAYLEKVEESVGAEEFGRVTYGHAFYLAAHGPDRSL